MDTIDWSTFRSFGQATTILELFLDFYGPDYIHFDFPLSCLKIKRIEKDTVKLIVKPRKKIKLTRAKSSATIAHTQIW